jgi:secreted Zn-dependent insulinase-like peptidase
MLEYYLTNKLSQASRASYEVLVKMDRYGLTLKIKGFNEKISQLVDLVTSFLPNCMNEAEEEVFTNRKNDKKESYIHDLNTAANPNNELLAATLLQKFFLMPDLYNKVNLVTLNDLKEFSMKFFYKLKICMLAQGNITKAETLKIVKIVRDNLSCQPLLEDVPRKQRCYQLPLGTSVIRIKSMAVNDDNSCIKNYYQIPSMTLRDRALARLVAELLNPKAYDYLRSKEQLAYSTASQYEDRTEVIGINVFIKTQERKHSYRKINEKLEFFMNEVARKTVEELTDAEFETMKSARIKALLADDLELIEEFDRNWDEIKDKEYKFDRLEETAKITKTLTKLDLQNFFKSFTQPENVRKLSVQVIGSERDDENVENLDKNREPKFEFMTEKLNANEKLITNIPEFQSNLVYYPVVRSFPRRP